MRVTGRLLSSLLDKPEIVERASRYIHQTNSQEAVSSFWITTSDEKTDHSQIIPLIKVTVVPRLDPFPREADFEDLNSMQTPYPIKPIGISLASRPIPVFAGTHHQAYAYAGNPISFREFTDMKIPYPHAYMDLLWSTRGSKILQGEFRPDKTGFDFSSHAEQADLLEIFGLGQPVPESTKI